MDVSFVAAKTRAAPLKNTTIPRLELMAAVLGSRLATSIKANHSNAIDEVFFYTDWCICEIYRVTAQGCVWEFYGITS